MWIMWKTPGMLGGPDVIARWATMNLIVHIGCQKLFMCALGKSPAQDQSSRPQMVRATLTPDAPACARPRVTPAPSFPTRQFAARGPRLIESADINNF